MEKIELPQEETLFSYDLHKDKKLSKDDECVEIYFLNDLHYGSRLCFEKQFAAFKRFILEKPNRFIIGLGDMMNQNIIGAVGSPFEDNRTPSEQRKQVTEELRPIKDRILCMIGGNHDSRVTKINDDNPLGIVCETLGIDFDPISAFVNIRYGSKNGGSTEEWSYIFYCHHGCGGGKRTGSKINNLEDLARSRYAEIYAVGHFHTSAASRQRYFTPDIQNKKIKSTDMLFIISSSWQLYGGYAKQKMLAPGVIGPGVVKLYNKKKEYRTEV